MTCKIIFPSHLFYIRFGILTDLWTDLEALLSMSKNQLDQKVEVIKHEATPVSEVYVGYNGVTPRRGDLLPSGVLERGQRGVMMGRCLKYQ